MIDMYDSSKFDRDEILWTSYMFNPIISHTDIPFFGDESNSRHKYVDR